MTTLIKIIVSTLTGVTLFSCNFDMNFGMGVRGNGDVVMKERIVHENFTTIKATEGLDVYLTQGTDESIVIEADENLHDLILTDIEDGVLKIHTKENIGYSKAKKVLVSFRDISQIISTSGSDVYSTNTINADNLNLRSTSGSDMKLDVNTSTLHCEATSGSDLKLSGKTNTLIAEATSGSDIKAGELFAESSEVKATSGADITINTSKQLTARASSGGDINYYGNPERVDKKDSSSGSIRKK
ncbi:head GIN domain-containing protein [Aestuariivivens sediminicola]|uniref:head GIN domain-containing protein n=1 Tax=Aestuariivivens sediminicola TaxID=2913560 RepID=UPI001F56156D|nr:head GIN domain-containing protein [Aestuariivivens sediminicola]